LDWLEFNIHIRQALTDLHDLYEGIVPILLDFVEPFVNRQRGKFSRWHYLLEPDNCRDQTYCEIRLRFEGERANLEGIKSQLVTEFNHYANQTSTIMRNDELLGSHEGCHGDRSQTYAGSRSERFGGDWDKIVEIMQIGSESALKILRLGRKLAEKESLKWVGREQTYHPYYLHLPANQLFIEP